MGSPHLPPPPLLDPAWYPDPTGRYEARYWDGRKWTSHISHYGATGADPLLRARWDRVWVRGLRRLILWGAVAGAGYWGYDNYWPRDDRDLIAEQELIDSAVMIAGDLGADGGWTPNTAAVVSPLTAEITDDGDLDLAACGDFESTTTDALDEPRASSSFGSSDGLRSASNATTLGAGEGFAKDYLDELRVDEAGTCLGALWVSSMGTAGVAVTSTQAMSEPSFGDETVWWRLSGTDATGAFPVEVLVDLLFVRIDRAVTEYTFSGSVEAVGVDVQRSVITVDVARIRELLDAYDADPDDSDGDDQNDEVDAEDPADDG